MGSSVGRDVLTFGDFELDMDAAELRRGGQLIALQPQPFKLLVLLVTRAGALVSRDEIRQELWPGGTFVEFDQSVNFSIRRIREALNDRADRPAYIQTVPKRGYRFIAPVGRVARPPAWTWLPDSALNRAIWRSIAELRLAQRRHDTWTRMMAAAMVALIIAILLLLR